MGKFIILSILSIAQFSFSLTNSEPAEESQWRAVVFIHNEGLDESGQSAKAYCNGTFISPKVIVTAAHCLTHAEVLQKKETTVEIGEYRYVQRPDGATHRVGYKSIAILENQKADFRFVPSLLKKLKSQGVRASVSAEEDLAYIILHGPVDLQRFQIEPIPMLSLSEWEMVKKNFVQFSSTLVSVNPLAHMNTTDTKRLAVLDYIQIDKAILKSKSFSRVEPYDSGAPLFVELNGKLKLLAVTKGVMKNLFQVWDVFCLAPQASAQIGLPEF